jgi:hypothetical protein
MKRDPVDIEAQILARAQIANQTVGRLIFELHGIFADQFTALIIAAACERLEMEASPG